MRKRTEEGCNLKKKAILYIKEGVKTRDLTDKWLPGKEKKWDSLRGP